MRIDALIHVYRAIVPRVAKGTLAGVAGGHIEAVSPVEAVSLKAEGAAGGGARREQAVALAPPQYARIGVQFLQRIERKQDRADAYFSQTTLLRPNITLHFFCSCIKRVIENLTVDLNIILENARIYFVYMHSETRLRSSHLRRFHVLL